MNNDIISKRKMRQFLMAVDSFKKSDCHVKAVEEKIRRTNKNVENEIVVKIKCST